MSGSPYLEPIVETFTEWHNPLDVPQHVDVREGDNIRPFRHTFKPGETKQLPSRFDSIIHRVHNGVIIGGQAPQLVRVNGQDVLDDALNTELSKKKKAEAELASAALQRQVAEDAATTAAAAVGDADKKIAKQRVNLPPELAKG